jgi:3-phenylpropionate/trans-cinnamate dioxygenase ferredoxin reductase subunit
MAATEHGDVVIVGGGQAGATAALALREFGFRGSVTLVCGEPALPYERPPLSKEILLGTKGADAIRIASEADYLAKDIQVLTGAVVQAIDTAKSRVRFDDGRELTYSHLVLATGAQLRRLSVPGSSCRNVFYLRDINDSHDLRTVLLERKRLVVVGGGFIGLEVATAANRLGCEVTVLEAGPTLMGRAVAAPIAEYFRSLHESRGVRIRLATQLQAIVGDHGVEGVAVAANETIAADAVLVGIGVDAKSTLAEQAGLMVDNGILVDEQGRTSVRNIFACGDACRMDHSFYGAPMRLETWQNAIDTGRTVAAAICNQPCSPPAIPWFWSDQAGVNFQMAGIARDWDDIVFRGDMQSGKFSAFLLRDAHIVAANTINNGREMRFARQTIAAKSKVDRDKLADPSSDLKACVSQA